MLAILYICLTFSIYFCINIANLILFIFITYYLLLITYGK